MKQKGRLLVCCAAAWLLTFGCGGSISTDAGAGGVGASGAGGSSGLGGAGTGGAGTGGAGTGGAGTGGTGLDGGVDARPDVVDAAPDYVEPGCPDAEVPPPDYQCDPLATPSDCGPGEACYPYVDYPSQPCETERYGTYCVVAGTGQQGDPCGGDVCAAGFVCAIGGSNGAQCMQICSMDGKRKCPPGLLCQSLDVGDIHVCF